MASASQSIENVIPSSTPYRKQSMEDDARNYEHCLHSEELQHAEWLEKIKLSSAENYRAGFLAGSSSQDNLLKSVKGGGETDDVRSRLFETIPAPCKAMNTNSFQRCRDETNGTTYFYIDSYEYLIIRLSFLSFLSLLCLALPCLVFRVFITDPEEEEVDADTKDARKRLKVI